ncbi:MAG: heparan-alpha-glucosaminide N-acetyltransferase domain-containing protein, partial [Syntrophobacteraceae bacterium]
MAFFNEVKGNNCAQSLIAAPGGRLASLDAFRGLALALMILVDSPGDHGAVFSFLSHAAWNGWTIADTIFPAFLFMVGVSIVFSLDKHKEAGSQRAIIRRILKRT